MDILCLLTVLMMCYYTQALKISKLVVPEEIQYGTRNSIILDCEYELEKNDTDTLVIKWYFEKHELIYQWIVGNKPQAVGRFQDIIDTNYIITNDPYTKHRALKINKVTPDLTGAYTCSVSCFYSDESATQYMVIYEPPKDFVFKPFTNNSELLCSVYDISPEPVISVYAIGNNLTQVEEDIYEDENDTNGIAKVPNGFYNVTKSFKYNLEEIDEPTLFVCELTIPKTKFRRILNQTYYPDGEPTSTTSDYYNETTTVSPIPDNAELARSSSTIMFLTLLSIIIIGHL